MSSTLQNSLLPIGQMISHRENRLEIVKRLGSGLTAEVYQAKWWKAEHTEPIDVAIKAMRTLEFPETRAKFIQERDALRDLNHFEEKASDTQELSLKTAATYYDHGEYEGVPYILMELISGKRVEELLGMGQNFPEKQALVIGWQLYWLLEIMHEGLKKTYIDLKYENLWWVDAASSWGGQLKMTDFGTLEDVRERGIRRDILQGAVYLCKVSIGFTPDVSLGILRQNPTHDLDKSNLSWGFLRVLRRLLHRNPDKRFTSAQEVADELRTLVDFWSLPSESVLLSAQKNIEKAETASRESGSRKTAISETGRRAAIVARSALEIISKRLENGEFSENITTKQVLNGLLELVNKILEASGYFLSGRGYLLGGSYGSAREKFEGGMDWENQSALFRRWAYLAQIGESVGSSAFEANQEKALEALDALNRERWDESIERLEKLKDGLDSPGLAYMRSECRLFQLIAQAEQDKSRGEYRASEKAYRDAAKLWDGLLRGEKDDNGKLILAPIPTSYSDPLKDEIGDLQNLAFDMMQFAKDADIEFEIKEKLKSYLAADFILEDIDEMRGFIRSHWSHYPMFDFMHQLVLTTLDKKMYLEAFSIAQTVLGFGPPADNAFGITRAGWDLALLDLQVTKALEAADRALRLNDTIGFANALDSLPSDPNIHPAFMAVWKDLSQKAERSGRARNDSDLLLSLAAFYAKSGDQTGSEELRQKAEQILENRREEYHSRIDRLITDAESLLQLGKDSPEALRRNLEHIGNMEAPLSRILLWQQDSQARLEQAHHLTDQALKISRWDGYHQTEINLVQKQVESDALQIEHGVDLYSRNWRRSYQNKLSFLDQQWGKLETRQSQIESEIGLSGDEAVQKTVVTGWVDDLLGFMYSCYATLVTVQSGVPGETETESLDTGSAAIVDTTPIEVLIEKAKIGLNRMGVESWKLISEESQAQYQKASTSFEKATDAFNAGKLEEAAGLITRLEDEWPQSLELKKLSWDVILIQDWRTWQAQNQELLKNGKPDPALLKKVREYLALGLPEIYWSESAAAEYLPLAQQNAFDEVSCQPKYVESDYVLKLREWLNSIRTSRIASGISSAEQPHWKVSSWLRDVYLARRANKTDKLRALGERIPAGVELDLALSGLDESIWKAVVEKEQKKEFWRKLALISGSGVSLLALLGVACGLAYQTNSTPLNNILFGTATNTLTFTPTITPTHTITPTLTDTPIPTLTPTPIPESGYLVPDVLSLYPVIPLPKKATAWVLNPETGGALDQTVWETAKSSDPAADGMPFFFTNTGGLEATWNMDQPFQQDGQYLLYFIDTVDKSGGYGTQHFDVRVDGVDIQPMRGSTDLILNTRGAGQKTDDWLPLGLFKFKQGQTLSVLASIPLFTAEQKSAGLAFFAYSRVLVIQLPDAQAQILNGLPKDRTLVGFLDNLRAIVLNGADGKLLATKYQGLPFVDDSVQSWGNEFRFLNADELKTVITPDAGGRQKVRIEWLPAGRLSEGDYELWVWTPAQHAGAVGRYNLYKLLMTGELALLGRSGGEPVFSQADHPGAWYSLGKWRLDEESPVVVFFDVDVRDAVNAGKEIGYDLVALVKVK
jgi:serine/threonine protein kinase